MPSYVVTGASRGLGYAFIKKFSSDPSNIVIGLVRNKAATEAKIAKDGLPKNITILQADITDRAALEAAAHEVSAMTRGQLNYLINNAALINPETNGLTIAELAKNPDLLVSDMAENYRINVIGPVITTTTFHPLLLASSPNPAKIATLTTGMADLDLINYGKVSNSVPYSASKAALNVAVAKFNAVYGQDPYNMLFLAISPGLVATGPAEMYSDENDMIQKFKASVPGWKGPLTPEESADMVTKVLDESEVSKGDGGKFLSHKGNKEWL